MFMKKKKKSCPSPVMGAVLALPLLAVGAFVWMKKKGKKMLKDVKCCCKAAESTIDEMTK